MITIDGTREITEIELLEEKLIHLTAVLLSTDDVGAKIEAGRGLSLAINQLKSLVTCENCRHCLHSQSDQGGFYCVYLKEDFWDITICACGGFRSAESNHKPFQMF